MNQTIAITQFAAALAARTGYTVEFSEKFVIGIFRTISEALAEGREVHIAGFGSFTFSADGSLQFMPAQSVADEINEPFSMFEPVVLDDSVTDDALDAAGAEEPNAVAQDEDASEEESSTDVSDGVSEEITDAPAEESVEPEVVESESVEPEVQESEQVELAAETEEPIAVATVETAIVAENTAEELDEEVAEVVAEPAVESPKKPLVVFSDDDEDDDDEDDVYEEMRRWKRHTRRRFVLGLALGLFVGAAAMWCVTAHFGLLMPKQDKLSGSEIVAENITETAAEEAENVVATDEEQPEEPITPKAERAVVTDTVTKNNYLAIMSRKHYGTYEFWVYIYEENASKLSHPDRVEPGTVVVIPPAEKYSIDANNPESIKRAKALQTEIYNRFK